MTHFPLVLVDDRRYFKDSAYGEQPGALTFRTAEAALQWFATVTPEDSIGELWLDHDLGRDENGNEIDVRPFVKELERAAFFDEAPHIDKVWVHTSNNISRKWIMDALQRHFHSRVIDADQYFYNMDIDVEDYPSGA